MTWKPVIFTEMCTYRWASCVSGFYFLFPSVERRPYLCWPMCCCCTAFPGVGRTARGKCAALAGSSGSGASSARTGWWRCPESGRWSCKPETNNYQTEKPTPQVDGCKKYPPALLTHDTTQQLHTAATGNWTFSKTLTTEPSLEDIWTNSRGKC